MPFAQLVTGSPGAGKSTYCAGMQQFLTALTPPRPCSVVNLDPANDQTNYECALDIRDLVMLEDVMEKEELGPNGGVLWALEELEADFDAKDGEGGWFKDGLKSLGDNYVLFDCPGQVELFTHHASLRNVFLRLDKMGYRMTVLHLTDSLILTRPSLYISSVVLALRAMLQLDLPHLNVLTKIDRLPDYGQKLPFNLDFYTEVQELNYLLPFLEKEQKGESFEKPEGVGDAPEKGDKKDDSESKFAALNRALVELIEDFALVSFIPLAVEDRKSMLSLLYQVDRAGGYAFGPSAGVNQSIFGVAMKEPGGIGFGEAGGILMDVRNVQERWIDRRDEMDEIERREWEEEAKARDNARQEAEQLAGAAGTLNGKASADEQTELDSDEDSEQMAGAVKSGIKIVKKGG